MGIPLLYPYMQSFIQPQLICLKPLYFQHYHNQSPDFTPPCPFCFSVVSGDGAASRSAMPPCLRGTLIPHSGDLSARPYLFPLSWNPYPHQTSLPYFLSRPSQHPLSLDICSRLPKSLHSLLWSSPALSLYFSQRHLCKMQSWSSYTPLFCSPLPKHILNA